MSWQNWLIAVIVSPGKIEEKIILYDERLFAFTCCHKMRNLDWKAMGWSEINEAYDEKKNSIYLIASPNDIWSIHVWKK